MEEGETPAPRPPVLTTSGQTLDSSHVLPLLTTLQAAAGWLGLRGGNVGEAMAPGQASPPPTLVHLTTTPAASASRRRRVPEHGDSWGVQRRQRGALEGGRRGPGPGPGAAGARGRPHGSHGEAGPGCKPGPPASHVVLAGTGREGCQSPVLRCCCL